MPYKSERIKLSREQDRRVKLSDEQKDEIRHKYELGIFSQRALARESKRIQCVKTFNKFYSFS